MKRIGYFLLVIISSGFLLLSLYGYWRGSATESWSEGSGTSLSVYLEEDYNFWRGKRSGHGKSYTYTAHISYQYTVDGTEHVSSVHHIDFLGNQAPLTGSRSYLENVLQVSEKYAEGNEITVFYDRHAPERAVLERGYQGYLPTYLLAALLALGYGLWGVARRNNK